MRSERRGPAVVLAVEGEVDLQTAPELDARLGELEIGRDADLVLDLTGVTFLDSTGLGLIVKTHHAVAASGFHLKLVCADPKILKIIRLTRLDEVVSIFDTVDGACAI
jgi:anti-sigma B factor antagonist